MSGGVNSLAPGLVSPLQKRMIGMLAAELCDEPDKSYFDKKVQGVIGIVTGDSIITGMQYTKRSQLMHICSAFNAYVDYLHHVEITFEQEENTLKGKVLLQTSDLGKNLFIDIIDYKLVANSLEEGTLFKEYSLCREPRFQLIVNEIFQKMSIDEVDRNPFTMFIGHASENQRVQRVYLKFFAAICNGESDNAMKCLDDEVHVNIDYKLNDEVQSTFDLVDVKEVVVRHFSHSDLRWIKSADFKFIPEKDGALTVNFEFTKIGGAGSDIESQWYARRVTGVDSIHYRLNNVGEFVFTKIFSSVNEESLADGCLTLERKRRYLAYGKDSNDWGANR